MAKNQIQGGTPHTTLYANSSGSTIMAGTPVVLASTGAKKGRVGVALVDIPDGESGTVAISGCFRFAKVSAAVIAQGESVTWDSSAGEVDDNAATPASGDVAEFGMAAHAAGNGDVVVDVWIEEPGTYTA